VSWTFAIQQKSAKHGPLNSSSFLGDDHRASRPHVLELKAVIRFQERKRHREFCVIELDVERVEPVVVDRRFLRDAPDAEELPITMASTR
jgi:hypothetical protein